MDEEITITLSPTEDKLFPELKEDNDLERNEEHNQEKDSCTKSDEELMLDSERDDNNKEETSKTNIKQVSNTYKFKCGIEYVCIPKQPHCEYDVYIGGSTYSHRASKWENKSKSKDATQKLIDYWQYLKSNRDLYNTIPDLRNQRIACW